MLIEMKKAVLASCAAVVCLFGSGTLSASAYSAEDVAAKARYSGWPEYLVQAGLNEWSTGNYSEEDLNAAYDSVSEYDEKSGELIANYLGVDYDPTAVGTVETGSDEEMVSEAAAGDSDQTVADDMPGVSPSKENVPVAEESLIVTKTDGTAEERISKSDFIDLPIEEKKAYIASLSEDSKKDFVASMTIEERNSIIKQLPAEDKAELIQTYIDAAKNMGMNIAVDTIDDDQISMTIRNKEGQIIGKNAVGTIIDETGISHTGEWLTAALIAMTSVLGFLFVYRRMGRVH